jgi:hypothetical protein
MKEIIQGCLISGETQNQPWEALIFSGNDEAEGSEEKGLKATGSWSVLGTTKALIWIASRIFLSFR